MTHEFFTGLDFDENAPDEANGQGEQEELKDNRNFIDNNTSQKMTA